MFTMKFELSFCGKSYSSAFLFQILMRKNGQQVLAYVWFLIFPSREMLSTILTYFVFQVNVFSETTASFLLSQFYQLPFTCGERCEKNWHIFLSAGIVTVCRLQKLTFFLSFVITLQNFWCHLKLIVSKLSSLILFLLLLLFLIVLSVKMHFFLVWIVFFVLFFSLSQIFLLKPLNVFVYLGIQTYFSRW